MSTHSMTTYKRLYYGIFFVSSFLGTFFSIPEASADDDTEVTAAPSQMTSAGSLSLTVGDQTEVLSAEQLSDWFSIQPKLGINTRFLAEIENTRLCPRDLHFCAFALSEKTRARLHNQSMLMPKQEAIQSYINTLDAKVSVPATDAKFSVTDNKISVFSLSQDGRGLDKEKSVSLITEALANGTLKGAQTLSLPVIVLKPSVTSSDADKFGITELIGEGSTNFAGSPKNRIHNFKRAIEQFNGIMIAPNEEFSFVNFLGDVDGEHGYLPELVIKQNKTEPEFGGGICQVSSTIFRAAIYSGLKITARRNHAYPVSYYKPYGMDATIYIPRPDLKFTNNTPGYILMQAVIDGTKLTFRFYGTSDGRTTEVDGPHILERNPDGSMKTIFTQKVTDASGNVIIKDDFRSSYASPSKYPHPGQEPVFTEKPDNWSKDQWSEYKQLHSAR
ncbi:MAG: VanW family protein [Candidatus Moranbacteria bacterium]|nr:VanW family protein [Candidatus Moranbacteria bacterium]